MKRLFILFLAVVLAACTALGKSDVERNQQKWQNANISHYQFQLNVGCFCTVRDQMPVTVEVQDGKVVSMEYQSGNEIDASSRELFEKYATIDRIFSELETNINGKADEFTVAYDPTYGFPAKINVDFIKKAVDDELAVTVSNFEKLP